MSYTLQINKEEDFTSPYIGVEALLFARKGINPFLEQARKDGIIKNSKEAKVVLKGSGWNHLFQALHDYYVSMEPHQFANALSVGEVEFAEENLSDDVIQIDITQTALPKCARCWLRTVSGWSPVSDVGTNPTWKELCNRCAKVVDALFQEFLDKR